MARLVGFIETYEIASPALPPSLLSYLDLSQNTNFQLSEGSMTPSLSKSLDTRYVVLGVVQRRWFPDTSYISCSFICAPV